MIFKFFSGAFIDMGINFYVEITTMIARTDLLIGVGKDNAAANYRPSTQIFWGDFFQASRGQMWGQIARLPDADVSQFRFDGVVSALILFQ